MAVYSPCTWNMTAAQLVTPTSSQLAAVNAIQAMITSSTYWTVNSTGTTTAGYKYVEARLTNTSSVYKDYRVLFVERVNTSTNKNYFGTNPFNTTNNVMVYFAPDGGSSWCTFTPANIETANNVYVGTRYRPGTTTWQWMNLPGPWTAFWMYECDGQMWISNRTGATSYYLTSVGASYISARPTHVDYNEANTEVGLPGMYQRTAAMSTTVVLNNALLASSANVLFWYNSTGTTKVPVLSSSPAHAFESTPNNQNQTNAVYSTTSNSAVFKPIMMYTSTGVAADSSNFLVRGAFWGANMQTRTTVKDASGVNTLGYSWYPDDIATPTTNNTNLMFMNTP